MWARIIELMLGIWLAISPFIFRYPDDALFFWCNDLISSSLIIFFALITFYDPLRKMHLCQILLGVYLIALNFLWNDPIFYAPLQNYAVLGLLLVMIGLVPTDADKPPKPWRNFFNRDKKAS